MRRLKKKRLWEKNDLAVAEAVDKGRKTQEELLRPIFDERKKIQEKMEKEQLEHLKKKYEGKL